MTLKTALLVATFLGSGKLSQKMPGTLGTLAALPIAYWVSIANWPSRVAAFSAVFLLGVWACYLVLENREEKNSDPGWIVIDEVLGMMLAALFAAGDLVALAVAFVLFRFFDIAKIQPVRFLDQWSKKQTSSWKAGLGVMLDDVAAAIQTLLVLGAYEYFRAF